MKKKNTFLCFKLIKKHVQMNPVEQAFELSPGEPAALSEEFLYWKDIGESLHCLALAAFISWNLLV